MVSGKVPPEILERAVYSHLGSKDSRVLVGPGIGRDSTIIRLDKSKTLVCSTDPITGASKHMGAHAVHVNANDIAAAGARPSWFFCTILLPPGHDLHYLESIMQDVEREARKLRITVAGGHTETTPGVSRAIIAGFMVGSSTKKWSPLTGRGKQGDRIIMTKTAGIEGTAILAADHSKLLREKGVPSRVLARAVGYRKMISVIPEATVAIENRRISAMHDPTEGGVQNGLWELAEASDRGIEVLLNRIPVSSDTLIIAKALGLDPTKLLASGSLLILVRPSESGSLVKKLRRSGISAVEIGRIGKTKGKRVLLNDDGKALPLIPVNKDEIYKI